MGIILINKKEQLHLLVVTLSGEHNFKDYECGAIHAVGEPFSSYLINQNTAQRKLLVRITDPVQLFLV